MNEKIRSIIVVTLHQAGGLIPKPVKTLFISHPFLKLLPMAKKPDVNLAAKAASLNFGHSPETISFWKHLVCEAISLSPATPFYLFSGRRMAVAKWHFLCWLPHHTVHYEATAR